MVISSIKSYFFGIEKNNFHPACGKFDVATNQMFVTRIGATLYFKRSYLFYLILSILAFVGMSSLLTFLLGDFSYYKLQSSYVGILIGVVVAVLYLFKIGSISSDRKIEDATIAIRGIILLLFGLFLLINIGTFIMVFIIFITPSFAPSLYFQLIGFNLGMLIVFYIFLNFNSRVFLYNEKDNTIVVKSKINLPFNAITEEKLFSTNNNNNKFHVAVFELDKEIISSNITLPMDPVEFFEGGKFVDVEEITKVDNFLFSLFLVKNDLNTSVINEDNFDEAKINFTEICTFMTFSQLQMLLNNLKSSLQIEFKTFQIKWKPKIDYTETTDK